MCIEPRSKSTKEFRLLLNLDLEPLDLEPIPKPTELYSYFYQGDRFQVEMISLSGKNFKLGDKNHGKTTVELQWLEHLWDYEDMIETGVV